MQLVGAAHTGDERHPRAVGVLGDRQFCGNGVDGVDEHVDFPQVAVEQRCHVVGAQEHVERLHLAVGVDVVHHVAHHFVLFAPERAVERDGLTVDVGQPDDVVVDDDQMPHAAARQRLHAVRPHAAQADDHDGGGLHAVEAGAGHDDLELLGGRAAARADAQRFSDLLARTRRLIRDSRILAVHVLCHAVPFAHAAKAAVSCFAFILASRTCAALQQPASPRKKGKRECKTPAFAHARKLSERKSPMFVQTRKLGGGKSPALA